MHSGALPADATCGAHAERTAAFVCGRCGTFGCRDCAGRIVERRTVCRACDAKIPRRAVWWQGLLVLVLGGGGAQVAGAIVLVIAAGIAAATQNVSVEAVLMSFSSVGPSIVATGLTMALAALALPFLAKVPVREALGVRGAPWAAFLAAPIGILGLGPTSDFVRQRMVDVAPWATFGTLEQLDAIVRSAPAYAVVPLFALVPGVCEELLFRGAFQRSIRRPALAISLSAVLFAVYHMDPHHVAAVLPLGFYLAWLGHRTESVLVPISAHIVNNGAAVILALALGSADEASDPWWMMPVGWAVAASAIAVIWWTTRASEPAPALAPVVVPIDPNRSP